MAFSPQEYGMLYANNQTKKLIRAFCIFKTKMAIHGTTFKTR